MGALNLMADTFKSFLDDTRAALDAACIAASLYEATAKVTRRDLQGSFEVLSGDMEFEHHDTCDDQLTMIPVIIVRYNNSKDRAAVNKEIDKTIAELKVAIDGINKSEYGQREDVFDVQLTGVTEPELDNDSKFFEVRITIIAYITRGK